MWRERLEAGFRGDCLVADAADGRRWLIKGPWLRAAVSLADRQLFALVTAASCHLGPSDGGGRRHAKGVADKVRRSLAY